VHLRTSQLVSSSVPALIIVSAGMAAASLNREEPQSGQKLRISSWPLSPLSRLGLEAARDRQRRLGNGPTTENAVPEVSGSSGSGTPRQCRIRNWPNI